jgi:hypothetical protein
VDRLKIVVSGLIAQYPLGGMTWHYVQYLAGLRALGHDVFYLEETLRELAGGVAWAYRFPWRSTWHGAGEPAARAAVRDADVVLNVSGVLRRPGDWERRGVLVFVDTDPVFTQIKLLQGRREFSADVDAHDRHFTFGETLPEALRATGHDWIATRQPVVPSLWRTGRDPGPRFTTVMNWTSYKPVRFDGREYGQKDVEMTRVLDLPALVAPVPIELAVNDGKTRRTPVDLLRHRGWHVEHPDAVCGGWAQYRDYLQASRGEFSVAKNGYVQGRCGWFSERSACYLAAGRPVIAQNTGFDAVLPAGRGLLAWSSVEEAAECIRGVERDYDAHARAARRVAGECFEAAGVLGRLLGRC